MSIDTNPLADAVLAAAGRTAAEVHAMLWQTRWSANPCNEIMNWKSQSEDHPDGPENNEAFPNAPWTEIDGSISQGAISIHSLWFWRGDDGASVKVVAELTGNFHIDMNRRLPETIGVQRGLALNDVVLLPVIRDLDLRIVKVLPGAFGGSLIHATPDGEERR